MRRRAAIVFLPEVFYYLSNFIRVLPSKVTFPPLWPYRASQVQLLLTDFFDTGIDMDESTD